MLEPLWVLVADGGAARFLFRQRPGVPLVELEELAQTAPEAEPARDRQFRTHDRFGHGRHALATQSSPHEEAERDFLEGIAARIDAAMKQKGAGKLALVAPPRALGILRDALSREARAHLACEIAKDLRHEPVASIDARLRESRV